ncbi:hypothetical protein IFR05_010033 [Cadophora sp. M221]|nr:hypothetical protein IFR05_010033 [Cadophora sp. M221]
MAEPFCRLYDLSLDIVKTLLDHVIETIGLNETVRLRLVCKLFDREIPAAVYRSRALELPEYRNFTASPSYKQIVQEHLLYRALADGKRKQNLSARLHRILETLLPEEDCYAQRYQASLRTLIAALVSVDGSCEGNLELMRYSKEPTLLDSTLSQDCMRAAAVLGIPWLFDDIVADASRDCKHSLFSGDGTAAFKQTPLIFATIGGQQELVSRILNAHTNSNHSHDRWQISSALIEAVRRGNEEIVLLLLGANRRNPSELHHLLRYAAAANKVSIFNLLCDRLHATPNDFRSLREAARHGHIDFVKLCLENGTDINANSSGVDDMWELESPLQIASSRGYRDIVQLLLAHGANATDYVEQFSALSSAASNGHCEIIRDLLAAGSIPVHNERWSPLTRAVRNGQVRAVEVLLDSGVELWYKDRALSLAAEGGYGSLVKILFERGAKIDDCGPLTFHCPMLEALAYGHAHIVKLLLKLGAKPVDPLQSRYAEELKSGLWPRSPVFGLKPMRQQLR